MWVRLGVQLSEALSVFYGVIGYDGHVTTWRRVSFSVGIGFFCYC